MFKYTLWKSIILETYPLRSVLAFESACSSAASLPPELFVFVDPNYSCIYAASVLRRTFFPASFFFF